MAVSAVTAGAQPQANPYAQARQAFTQLSSALQSGNLTAAQDAYNTLASSPAAQNGPFASAIQQIGQDLQSGDLVDAQKALASLQQQQKAHGHHHHHGGGIKPKDQADSTDQTQSATSASKSSASDPDGDGDTDGVSAVNGVDNDNKVSITV